MSRANEYATRLALAESAFRTAEAEQVKWFAPSGGASAFVTRGGDLNLGGLLITPADALDLARWLTETFDEPRVR